MVDNLRPDGIAQLRDRFRSLVGPAERLVRRIWLPGGRRWLDDGSARDALVEDGELRGEVELFGGNAASARSASPSRRTTVLSGRPDSSWTCSVLRSETNCAWQSRSSATTERSMPETRRMARTSQWMPSLASSARSSGVAMSSHWLMA